MKPSHKWILLGVFALLIGAGSLFLLRVTSQAEAPARTVTPARQTASAGNPDHELKELTVQLQKKPGHTPILMRMAQIEHDQGKLEDAAAHLRQVVKNEPANADAHLELGRVLYEKGDPAAAIAETEKSLDLRPESADSLYNLGAIYANGGDPQRARGYWDRAIKAEPASESGQKARLGLTRLQEAGNRR